MKIQCQRHDGATGSKSSAALENLKDSEDITRVWKNIKGNIKNLS
jgi:hypothetical protein